jgi:uncharacterized iron-regulated protein
MLRTGPIIVFGVLFAMSLTSAQNAAAKEKGILLEKGEIVVRAAVEGIVKEIEEFRSRVPQTLDGQESAALWRAVAEADVIYVGETHDKATDHAYELRLVRGMIRRRMAFAIGWEMFDQTQQALLDAWDRGAISLRQLFRDTGFDRGWAVYSPIYAKILETAQRSARNNVALNAPPALVRKVARGQSLSRQEQALLPRGFTTNQAAYRNFVSLMGEHPGMPAGHLRSFFVAQNVWDQTMADRILQFERRQSGAKLVVLTGRGHVAGGFGIPFYVGRKGAVQQLILLPSLNTVHLGMTPSLV